MFIKLFFSSLFKLPKNSVIIIYQGGLGNQLFQYLLGQELNVVYQKNVIYHDIRRHYESNHKSDIQNIFDLNLRKYNFGKSNFIVRFFLSPKFLRLNKFIFQKIKFSIFSNYIFDTNKDPIFLESIKNKNSLLIFFGTWHNLINQYIFSSNPENLKFKNKRLPKIFDFKKKFISLHVRRGDYLDPKRAKFHGNLDIDYYLSSVNFLRKRFGNVPVLLFSDDPNWIKKNLYSLIPNSMVISSKRSSPEMDFYIMSKGSFFVLSNSTFSWLSAFISKREDKFVVIPKFWFNGQKINSEYIYKEWNYKLI